MSRKSDFEKIKLSVTADPIISTTNSIVLEGDSLELLKSIPDKSISLILTDPPYHSTKKANIRGDRDFDADEHYLEWMAKYFDEWRRILRPNGTLFCFCSSEMSAELEVLLKKQFNILSHVVWTKPNEPGFDGWKGKMKKEALRQWYPHSERIIFAEPAQDGNLHRSSFASFLRKVRKQADLTAHQLAEITGAYGKVNHGGAVSNWETGRNIPSREQYKKVCDAILATQKVKQMPDYEDVIRPFMVDKTKEFTDVWNFPSVRPYKGKHPAEKPIEMLEHAISATTYDGDIVLDCFAGSGSTVFAALKLGRKAIAMEIEATWAESIADKVSLLEKGDVVKRPEIFKSKLSYHEGAVEEKSVHLPLFSSAK